ncbi:MAG: divergent polysaccharide deacetylase family protein [Cellvibrionaceae bacterium]
MGKKIVFALALLTLASSAYSANKHAYSANKHGYSSSKDDDIDSQAKSAINQLKSQEVTSAPTESTEAATKKTKAVIANVAIIIDDIGYNKRQGMKAIALPGNITYAIIPHSPNAVFLAQHAKKHQKEIMLHAPMSNINHRPMGESGLRESMGETDFTQALTRAINSVPHISGVNNHMGSLLTQKHLPMEWTMKELVKHGLYFIDSRTTSHSVAWKTAQKRNVPSLKRDVFLDHDRDPEIINDQFSEFIAIAKRRGYAIAIAHPYPETLAYLQQNLDRLASQGIRLVPASTLVKRYSPNQKQLRAEFTQ